MNGNSPIPIQQWINKRRKQKRIKYTVILTLLVIAGIFIYLHLK